MFTINIKKTTKSIELKRRSKLANFPAHVDKFARRIMSLKNKTKRL